MTTLTQLIEHYCPDGVEYVKLGDVAEVGTGKCDRKNATDDGEYPFFVRSEQVLRYPTYQFDEEAIIVPGEGGIGEIFHHINGKYALHQRAYRVHFIDEDVSTRYALYAFKSFFKNYVTGRAVTATVASLRKPMFTEFQFPLPPREVQDAIVERLDVFATLIESLDSEIGLREERFEYFREQLLNFDESDGVEYMKLEDVAEYSSLRVDSVDLNADTFVGVDNLLKDRGGKTLSEHGPNTKRSTKYQVGDVLLGNIRPYLRKIWHATNEGGCSGDVLAIHPSKVYSRFLYWTLFGDEFWHYNNNFSRGGKMPRGDKSAILAYQFPLPSLAVQQDIADKLDTMQALIDNLKYERDLRKAQFEYYREKLLTFNS